MPLRFDDHGMLLPPAEGMTVKRIPLPDDLIRLEALKAAVESSSHSELPSNVLNKAQKFETYIRDGGNEPPLYYDEETMQKVYDVLGSIQSITYTPEEIVSMLQNQGILFRERR